MHHKIINHLQLYLAYLTLQEEKIKYKQHHLATVNDNNWSLATKGKGPDIKKIFWPHFLGGQSNHFLLPHISSGAS